MQDRLTWIKSSPLDWVHANPCLGGWQVHEEIVRRYPKATAYIHEPTAARRFRSLAQLSPKGWQRFNPWAAKPIALAPGHWPEPVDMVWANMQLHVHEDPQSLLQQWHQSLRVDGFVMFSCLGPDSLMELRQLHEHMGWPVAGSTWTDMHDWGDMLVQTGFAEPVMDMERITLSYANAQGLLSDLRQLGRNLHPDRYARLRGRGWRQRWLEAVEAHWPKRSDDGQFLLTFEIVYGHALRPEARHRVDTTTRISLGEMKNMLRPG